MPVSNLERDIEFSVGVGAVRDLLERQGIDPAEVGQIHRHRIRDIKLYQGYAKDANDELQVVDLASVILSPSWEDGPEWELPTPGPSLPKLKKPKSKSRRGGLKKCVVLPDMQIGFYHDHDGSLVPTHDPVAISLAVSVIEHSQPDLVVMVGDNLDLPEMGKYRLSPWFVRTVQPSIDYATELMYQIRQVCPAHARIVWLAGNHEERLPNYLMDNASAAYGLRRGKNPSVLADEREHPVLSVPHMCRLDLSRVEYLPGYPANEFYINSNLRVIHGDRVKSRGSTAHVYLGQEKTSVIYGHIHRREYASRSFSTWNGAKEIMAATPGCLARVDGAVPSTKGGLDLYGRPLQVVEDWQQGIAIVDYEDEGDHWFNYESIPFVNGRCKAEGEFFSV